MKIQKRSLQSASSKFEGAVAVPQLYLHMYRSHFFAADKVKMGSMSTLHGGRMQYFHAKYFAALKNLTKQIEQRGVLGAL